MGTTSRRTRKDILYGIFVCLLFVNGLNADGCQRGCPKTDTGKLKYQPGNVYDYSFDSLVTVAVGSGSDADDTALKVNGHAKLYAEGNCAYTLHLDKVQVQAVKESLKKPFTEGIKKPIQFTMAGGELEPQICADSSDNEYSLNMKRAVVSLLQVSEKTQQMDVFGVCETLTSISNVGGVEVISKVRNLNKCGFREQIANGMVSGVVNTKAGIKSTPLLASDYSKEQKINNGIIEAVELTEEYKFVGATNGGAPGPKAKVKTNLKLVKSDKAAAPALANGKPKSIIFHQPHNVPVKNLDVLKKVLETTISRVDGHVKTDAAQEFTELIRLLRSADADTLTDLSAVNHPNKVLARKVYLDALFRVGTTESVQAIVKQIPKMSELEKKFAFLSFNLVEHVNKETLNQAASLLNGNTPKEAFLAVGNLVNKYCKHDKCDSSDIQVVSKKFTDSLKHCKGATKKDEDRIVYVLKGIRNTHKIADASVATLLECASNDRSARVRVAAIQAFVAASCNENIQQKALALLKDRNEDSEIRIEAYLAAVACPNAVVANEIAEIVNSETVYQVGGFIASHLKAIRDSTDDSRQTLRYHLENIRVTKKFPIDPRRYSFNAELSYAIESLGAGASADYNLIFSQNGFLPRSGRVNLTTEIFGTNFNVLEMSARQENLENILEYYFGPKGFFNKEPQEILNSLQSGGRSKRSLMDDSEKFAKKYKTYGSKSSHDMNLDLSLRFFGSELFFLSLGDNIPVSADDLAKNFFALFQKAKDGAKSFERNFECHQLFLDNKFVYPTGAGLPLELSAQGFAATKLTVAVEVDVDAILEDPRGFKYRLKLLPSFDVAMTGRIGVDALVLGTHLRVSSQLHSATGGDTRLELVNRGQGFNLDIELPRESVDLIELKHNVDFVISEQDKESKSLALKNKRRKSNVQENCFDQLQLFGLTVCYTASLPDFAAESASSSFPLVGPAQIGLRLQSEKKISLKGRYEQQPTHQSWKLTYDTPGSKVSHLTTLTFDLGVTPKIYARASFDNPEKKLAVEGGVKNDDKELVAYAQHEIDADKSVYKLGFTKNGNEYRPLIEVSSPAGVRNELAGYKTDGRVIVDASGDKNRYNIENFRLSRPDKDDLLVNGWIETTKASYNSELKIGVGKQNFLAKSHCTVDPTKGHSIGVFVTDESKPDSTLGGSIFLKLGDKYFKHELVLQTGEQQMQLNNELEYGGDNNKYKTANSLNVKGKEGVLASAKVDGEWNPDLLHYDVEVSRKGKRASFNVKVARNQHAQGDFDLDVNAKLNKHFVDLKAKADVKGGKYAIENTLATSWGTELKTEGEVSQRMSQQDVFIDLHGTVLITAKDKPTSWTLKVNGSPEKTTSDLKVSREGADWVVFSGEANRPLDKVTTGKVNLQLKDLLAAKGDFKLNKNGKGDLSVLVNFKKASRKVKIDSKFTISAPKYDVETTILFDAEKKLYYKTENIVDRTKFSTKNALEIGTEKVLFDASGNTKGEWRTNGELDGKFQLTIPSGRQFDGNMNRKSTLSKTGLQSGNVVLNLNDKLPSNEKRSFAVNGKIENFNSKTNEFALDSNVLYTNFAGKKLGVKQVIKHLPKGHFKSLEYSMVRSGDLLEGAEVNLIIDEYCPKHAIFRVNGKYGQVVEGNVNGNYNVGERGKPASYELQANVNLPNTENKNYALQTNGKYLRPETDGGLYEAELHFDQKFGTHSHKLDTTVQGNRQHGSYKLALESDAFAPVKFDGTYTRENQGDKSGKRQYNLHATYGEKFVKSNVDLTYANGDSANFHLTVQTSSPKLNNLDLTVKAKKSEDETYTANSQLQYNGESYGLNSIAYLGEHRKGVDLVAIAPEKTMKLSTLLELLGERKAKLSLTVEKIADLDIHLLSEADFTSQEDFHVKVDLDAPKLQMDKVQLEAGAQPNTAGKAITFNLKNAKETILAGTAQYIVKREKSKVIVEGQGQIQYYQKTNSANFKLVRQLFELATDSELGYSYTFNGTFGPKSATSTLKVTNKNFHLKLATCEEKQQCTNIEVKSVLTLETTETVTLEHKLMVLIDLRQLGYPHEFELQSKSTRHGFQFEHELDANIISNSNNKYQFIAKVKPTLAKAQLKLPKREILLESVQTVPSTLFGHYENTISFYFDKLNKPTEKTQISFSGDVSGVESGTNAINSRGVLKFEHPTIRTLTISGQLDANREARLVTSELVLDIFKTPDQKVIASSKLQGSGKGARSFNVTSENSLKSAGLGFEYDLSGHTAWSLEKYEVSSGGTFQSGISGLKVSSYMYGSRDHFEVLFNALDEEVINVNGDFNRAQYKTKLDTKLQILGSKPIALTAEIEPSRVAVAVKRNGLLDASGEFKVNKEAKFALIGAGKPLYNGRIALDAAHFLTTTYESHEDDTKAFLKQLEAEVTEDTKKARTQIEKRFQTVREGVDKQLEAISNSSPDFSKLHASYEQNLNEIVKELESDPALADLIKAYRKAYNTAIEFVSGLTKTVAKSYEKIHKSVAELYGKLYTVIKEKILPAWEEAAKRIATIIGDFSVEAVKILSVSFERGLKALKSFENDLKTIGKPLADLLKPISDAVQELVKALGKEWEEFLNDLKDYWAKLPSFEDVIAQLKQRLSKFKTVDELLALIRDVFDKLEAYSGSPEAKVFLKDLYKYIEAKLKNQAVNDVETLEKLYTELVNAIRSLVQMFSGTEIPRLGHLVGNFPVTIDALTKLPSWISFKFSPINYLKHEKWDGLREALLALKPPYDLLPPYSLKGHIADGQHIFTFDGKHLTFPGNCRYIIAQDHVDNNFTVFANLKDGQMKSVGLVDKKNAVELQEGGVLKLNGKPVEYPVHVDDIHVWRKYYTVWLRSEYGVGVVCTTDLKICHVSVNGFYSGKTRGLLGNGNAEPYDDFVQPDGVIADNYATFGNSYGVGACQPVAFEDHAAHGHEQQHDDICSELFGLESSLVFGYLVHSPKLYREACDHATEKAANKEEAACNIALAYASALRLAEFPVSMPSRCIKCNGDKLRERGDTQIVKTPTNKADIVFLVDTNVNKNTLATLVTPAISELSSQLKNRGITDVDVAVVAFNKNQQYPALLTSNGGKLNYNGKLEDLTLNGPNVAEPIDTGIEKVNAILKVLQDAHAGISVQPDESAFRLALDYPFRSNAAKTLVAVRSDSLEYGNVAKYLRSHVSNAFSQNGGIALHLIGPVKDLSVEGVPSEKIVGFNPRVVATTEGKDAKKRQKLKYGKDMGVDFVINDGGWVFSLDNFEAQKSKEQKKAFVNQIASSIADNLYKTEITSECTCRAVQGLHGHDTCTVQSTNFVPNKRPKAA